MLLEITRKAQPATVRQVFYLATVAGIVPKTEAGYDKVGRDLLTLRRSGRMPYQWITDSTRWMRRPKTFDDVEDALDEVARTYRKALWSDRDILVECWCEKDTVAGVLYGATSPYDVPLMVSKGFASETYLYQTAQYIIEADRPTYIYYFGDRDPSGMKIPATIERKLREFAPDTEIHFERLAVTPEQITAWDLPSRPTKREGNSHAKTFTDSISVELEAISPDRLRLLARQAIERHISPEQLRIAKVAEQSEREVLQRLAVKVRTDNEADDWEDDE